MYRLTERKLAVEVIKISENVISKEDSLKRKCGG